LLVIAFSGRSIHFWNLARRDYRKITAELHAIGVKFLDHSSGLEASKVPLDTDATFVEACHKADSFVRGYSKPRSQQIFHWTTELLND
jgi:hypothetical protein